MVKKSHDKLYEGVLNNPMRPPLWINELITFGIKQAWASLFGGLLLFFILATHYYYPFGAYLFRYDFLFLVAVSIQALLLLFKLEKPAEAVVIVVFHIVAMGMEIFKTSSSIGSWSYPEDALLKVGNVPLFAGFMYSAVGSFIARSWNIMEFRFSYYPPMAATFALAAAIYTNFFTHHYFVDLRWLLIVLTVVLFGRTWLYYTVAVRPRKMPLVIGWFLVALFIWFAENIGTYTRIWLYPTQQSGWQLVSPHKIIAWYLVIIISFVLVSLVKRRAFSLAGGSHLYQPLESQLAVVHEVPKDRYIDS